MTNDWTTRPISNLFLEKYALGELDASEARMLEARLAADPALRQRLAALKAHNPVFEALFPAEEMVPEIEAAVQAAKVAVAAKVAGVRAARQSKRKADSDETDSWFQRLFQAFPTALRWQMAGGFAVVALTLGPVVMMTRPGVEVDRIKGKQAELRLYRNTPGGPERVKPGTPASAGEVIQMEFHPGAFAFGAVVSVDGNGAVTWHWPTRPEAGTDLSALPGHRLPEAFRLDNAPGFERFHLLLSDRPLNLADLAPMVTASARQDEAWLARKLRDSVHVVVFTLKKGP